MAYNDSFSGNNFRSLILLYCSQLGWKIGDINDSRAVLKFVMESGSTQILYIIRHGYTLEFSVPSGINYESADDVPGWISTRLLAQNSQYKIGFWCIELISGRYVISIMHNTIISLMNIEYFQAVVTALVATCDEFEQAIVRILKELE
ncbi:MAG: hypothetical protein IGS39_08530 [Calothrix sp. C42_A2020_038]|nr:hypothetical protein [Calothrix sp. C42_A2020_038]